MRVVGVSLWWVGFRTSDDGNWYSIQMRGIDATDTTSACPDLRARRQRSGSHAGCVLERSKKVLNAWESQCGQGWCGRGEVVVMDLSPGSRVSLARRISRPVWLWTSSTPCPWVPVSSTSAVAVSNQRSRASEVSRANRSTEPGAL